jgi:hypothetical protein
VEQDADHIARDSVHSFIHYDFSDHKLDHAHACQIEKLIHSLGIKPDGCLPLNDECSILAALVTESLELRGTFLIITNL